MSFGEQTEEARSDPADSMRKAAAFGGGAHELAPACSDGLEHGPRAVTGRVDIPPAVAQRMLDSVAVRSARAQMAPAYIKLDLFLLVWLFVLGSFLGLVLEDAFHVVVFGEYESRAGLVWGPFSSIYGLGAVVLTLFLNRYYYTHDLIIFLISMVLGATLEFCASWMMETFWHAIAWDYTGTFGSIGGRTNFFFGVMWGCLGLFWVRMIMPVIKRVQRFFVERRDRRRGRLFAVLTWAMLIFMTVNCIATVLAIHRQGERAVDIPPRTQIDIMLDAVFPDEWLQERFHNMTVSSEVGTGSGCEASQATQPQMSFEAQQGNAPVPDHGSDSGSGENSDTSSNV